VRREKAERGEDPDAPKQRTSAPIKKDPRGALENVIKGQVYTIKGVEYTAGEDELILPENDKGNTKVDSEGRLLGGREYKLVTFTSASRGSPDRVYALTIDAARACGYTDSLAFLRRCPQLVKLSCNPDEREMLINVGRITGNLKHRAVTMVAMRNVFKLMGARLVKHGKWVDDDYDEERAVVDCESNGWTPHGPVLDEELAVNQYPSAGGPGRPAANAGILADAMASKSSLGSWYNVGGFTTQFGGNGADPWSDHHAKRGKLRQLGVTEEDWILRTAEDARRIDETMRGYREERLNALEGDDALRGWQYVAEQRAAGEIKEEKEEPKHPLANEITAEPPSEPLSPAPPENPTSEALGELNKLPEVDKTPGGKVVFETDSATKYGRLKMEKWVPGTVYAAYEVSRNHPASADAQPHTQMPHVPLRTQPTSGHEDRLSFEPWIGLNGSAKPALLPGFSSVEVVFDPSAPADDSFLAFGDGIRGPDALKRRRALIEEAEAWERDARAKRRRSTAASATPAS
jgi:chromatin structure-remodeling complex protein RSC7